MEPRKFRTLIDILLAEQNMMQKDIARKMGISERSFTNLKARENHHPRTIHKLSRAFGVPCEYFFDRNVFSR